jgi:hypothetical protein
MTRMSKHVRTPAESTGIEPLEGRLFLSAGPGRGHEDDDGGDKGSNLSGDSALVAVADFTGDKQADVITVARAADPKKNPKAQGPKTNTLTLLVGKGDGTFDAGSALNIDASKADRLLAADFNKDGKPDLAIVAGSKVSVYTGDGAGHLATTAIGSDVGRSFPAGVTVAAGDIDGDKAADLVAFNADNVWVALNDGTGKLLPAVQQSNPFGPAVPVALGDLDNDGRADLLGVDGDTLVIDKARASTGEFLLGYLPKMASTIPLAGKRLLIADVNGDMGNDVIAIGKDGVRVALQQFDPTQLTSLAAWVKTAVNIDDPSKVLAGDVDGDGKADLFQVAGGDKHDDVHRASLVLISNGDGTFHKLVASGDDDDDHDHDHDDGHGHHDDDDDHD